MLLMLLLSLVSPVHASDPILELSSHDMLKPEFSSIPFTRNLKDSAQYHEIRWQFDFIYKTAELQTEAIKALEEKVESNESDIADLRLEIAQLRLQLPTQKVKRSQRK